MDKDSGKNGESDEHYTPQTVYVVFTGVDRIAASGVPVDVTGWWEIHGLTFQAGLEVAYALTDGDRHSSCFSEHDLPRRRLTAGCTFQVRAGLPPTDGRKGGE